MTERGICVVAPPEEGGPGVKATPSQLAWVKSVRDLAAQRGFSVLVFRTVIRTSERKGESGRRLYVLEPWEADRLYKTIHRGQYAVFQAGTARILLDPLKEYSSANTIALARLVRYKSYFEQYDGHTDPSLVFDALATWMENPHIETPRDCRVLPLHVFAPKREWPGLMPLSGREEFERVHGKPSQLADEEERAWKQPSAMHGQEALIVGNYRLPAGYHWDVNAARTTSHLTSLVERWKFDRGAYANVSPDGHIRGGQSSGVSASREGAAPRPPVSQSDRPTKSRRRRHRPDGKHR